MGEIAMMGKRGNIAAPSDLREGRVENRRNVC